MSSASEEMLEKPSLLSGTEPVLAGFVPKGGTRWQQCHFNALVMRRFFHLTPESSLSVILEKIGERGEVVARRSRQLVFSAANANPKIEFDFSPVPQSFQEDDPRPILIVVEASSGTFRYERLFSGDNAYEAVAAMIRSQEKVGKGVHRIITTLDALESHWPDTRLRGSL